MKWTYSIKNKMTASAVLLILCLLVLFSNYLDRDHTNNVKLSISTLYEDRLIVEGYILKMTSDIYQIKEALQETELPAYITDKKIAQLRIDLDTLSRAYLKTKFTESEDIKFAALLKTLTEFDSSPSHSIDYKLKTADKALALLNDLSAIQLEESKLIIQRSEKLYLSGKLLSQFSFAIILVLLLILQALVFTSKTLNPDNQSSGSHLN